VLPYLEAGKVKLLAITNSMRTPIASGTPTVSEAGYPQLTLDGLIGFFGPADMPSELRERIAAGIRAAATDETIAARLAATGQILNPGEPVEFTAAIEEQRAKLAAAAKVLGVDLRQQRTGEH
jgi:tripartite-type tricarboxylate transporter receptor subunit TctC